MKEMGIDAKTVADQLGHTVDVNLNTYTQTPLSTRQDAVNRLETLLEAKHRANSVQEDGEDRNLLN